MFNIPCTFYANKPLLTYHNAGPSTLGHTHTESWLDLCKQSIANIFYHCETSTCAYEGAMCEYMRTDNWVTRLTPSILCSVMPSTTYQLNAVISALSFYLDPIGWRW
jgi:hypothetical protein